MRKISTLLFMCLMAVTTAFAQFASAPAFPGAEGYGRFTTGGRGGAIYHVTTLYDTVNPDSLGEGMLRYYITKKNGPRTIVFDVAGNIELKEALKIAKGDLSILGQTAPGQGICLKNYPLQINASNVIIRFIRCRLGDNGTDADAMNAAHHDDAVCHNIIVDHCSMSWCTDEVGSFYGNKDFTLQWCILSESLKENTAKDGTHGFGGIWGGQRATFHHNLLAHNDSRMIRFDHGYVSTLTGPVDYVNNVVYNWGGNSTYGGENNEGCESKTFNMINNYYKPGPSTSGTAKTRLLNPSNTCGNCTGDDVPGKFYMSGNYMYGSDAVTKDNSCLSAIRMDGSSPITYDQWKKNYVSSEKFTTAVDTFQYSMISQQPAETAFAKVLSSAGASLSRDNVDTRVTDDAKNGTGSIIDYTSDKLVWQALSGDKKTDTDGDGIPDDWETAHGLNPSMNDASYYDFDPKHYYNNFEVYANSLVEDIVKSERADADETFEEYYPDLTTIVKDYAFYYYSEPSTVGGFSTITYGDKAALALTGNSTKTYTKSNSITYDENTYDGIKLSNGAQNTFTAPEGKYVSSVDIISYKHGSGTRTCFWREVAGKDYGDSTRVDDKLVWTPFDGVSVITAGFDATTKNCAEPDVQTFDIGGKPGFTFTNYGEQLGFILKVTYGEASGIQSVAAAASPAVRVRKYMSNGRLVIETASGTYTATGARIK